MIFTSGGTESDNLAVKGAYWSPGRPRPAPCVVTSPIEHHAVLDSVGWLAASAGAEARAATGRRDTAGSIWPS